MFDRCPDCKAKLPLIRGDSCAECGAALRAVRHPFDNTVPDGAPDEEAATVRSRSVRTTTIVSIIIYFMLITAALSTDSYRTWIKAFGPRPLGLPIPVFVSGLLTLLYLPMPFAFLHFGRVAQQARHDGLGFYGVSALLYLSDVHHRHPHLTRSRLICLASLGYYVVVVVTWIIYTGVHGI